MTVALALPTTSSGGQLCAQLAALIAQPAAVPPLSTVAIAAQWTRTYPPTFAPPSAATVAAEEAPADINGEWTDVVAPAPSAPVIGVGETGVVSPGDL